MTMQQRRDLLLMMMPKIREKHGIEATLVCVGDDRIDFVWGSKSVSVLEKVEADLLSIASSAVEIIQQRINSALGAI